MKTAMILLATALLTGCTMMRDGMVHLLAPGICAGSGVPYDECVEIGKQAFGRGFRQGFGQGLANGVSDGLNTTIDESIGGKTCHRYDSVNVYEGGETYRLPGGAWCE